MWIGLIGYWKSDEPLSGKCRERLWFPALHSTGSKTHGSEVDVPIVYADYYYLEALLRKAKLEKKELLSCKIN